MKSSIKIDFLDRGTGVGLEPVIRIELIKSEDPRDTLIAVLFESLRGQLFLQLFYTNHKHVTTFDNLPDMEKTILLFRPEADTDMLMEVFLSAFNKWIGEEKYVTISDGWLSRGDEHISRDDLVKKFIFSLKTGQVAAPTTK